MHKRSRPRTSRRGTTIWIATAFGVFVGLTVAPPAANAATSWTGSLNCGTSYVELSFSSATGDLGKTSYEHVDYGASSYTVHRNYEVLPLPEDYVVRTIMHSVKWSIYTLGTIAQASKPLASCRPGPKDYGTKVSKSGTKDCGTKFVLIDLAAYAYEVDVTWTGNGPNSSGSRAYYPIFGDRYAFGANTGETSVSWTMVARGQLPVYNQGPAIYSARIDCG